MRPTSCCPGCSRVGAVDAQQGVAPNRRSPELGAQNAYGPPLATRIRFSCSCGCVWQVEKVDAYEHGAWLARVGLHHLLSPPSDVAITPAPEPPRIPTAREYLRAKPPRAKENEKKGGHRA